MKLLATCTPYLNVATIWFLYLWTVAGHQIINSGSENSMQRLLLSCCSCFMITHSGVEMTIQLYC